VCSRASVTNPLLGATVPGDDGKGSGLNPWSILHRARAIGGFQSYANWLRCGRCPLIAGRNVHDRGAISGREHTSLTDIRTVVVTDATRARVDAVVRAARDRLPAAMRAELRRVADIRGLGRCMDEVLLPTVRQIGAWPHSHDDEGSSVALAIETVRAWLDELISVAPVPADRPALILAGAPGDRHSVGLEALTVLLRYRHQPCRLLGTRVSPHMVAAAAQVNRPAAVIVAAQLESGLRETNRLIQLIDETGVLIFYAGAAYDSPAARRDVAGRYLGRNLAKACEVVLQAAVRPGE
jgi:methylmalonyl-CoA mutase cobalamin-binding subunit